MLKNYIKIAWRSLAKNKLYSTINVLGLSLGIAICLLITLFVKDEFSFDQFQENKNGVFRLVVNEVSPSGETFKFGDTGMVHGAVFSKQIPEIEALVRVQGEMFNIKHQNEVLVQNASKVDSSFFNVFAAEFIEGSKFKVLSKPNSIVISENVAKRFFGNEKALGKILLIDVNNNFENYQITGVIKNSPQNSSIQNELIMPFDYSKPQDTEWINFYLNTFFKIKKGTDIELTKSKLAKVFAFAAKDNLAIAKKEWNYNKKIIFGLQPFTDMHLSREYRAQNGLKQSSNKTLSAVLSGMALFILIIACINFINITISHSIQRSREIGIRKVIGGERKQLIYQFLGESFLLNTLAFLLAFFWLYLALPTFNQINSKSLEISYLLDLKLITYFIGIFLLTGFLAGFYPAIVLSGMQPAETLYGRFKFKGKNLLQKSLIVLQFGLATFFIILTLVQFRQVNLFTSKNLNYDDKNLIIVNTGGLNDKLKGETFIQELKANPNIKFVAPRNQGDWITKATVNNSQEISPYINVVNEDFVKTLGLKIKEGRNFSKEFLADSTLSIMVNEAFVREAKWKNPIGQIVNLMNRENYNVIGIVKDYHFASLYDKVKPQIFTSNNSYGQYGTFFIKADGQNIPNTLNFIENKFKKVFPTKPYSYEYQTDINFKQYEKEQTMKQIVLSAACLIIFISAMGLFGLSVLTTEKRRKEIGIRKVLGASITNIAQKLSIDFVKLITIAFLIFAPLAYFTATTLLENYPYRISISADLFIFCFLGIMGITLLTISYHAIKAAIANPVKSLKTE
jgi:putative ABC transport system permease protein